MRTLFLGSYGFGNLGDELCLIDAVRKFQPREAWAFSFRPEFTKSKTNVVNFITDRPEISSLKPERVVLGGGGLGFWPSLRDNLHWMRDALLCRDDVELHIYNIGVASISAPEWSTDEIVKRVIARLASFSVRDHVSRWLVTEWGLGIDPEITYYPEQNLPPEPFPMPTLRRRGLFRGRRLIGFSITAQPAMFEVLRKHQDKVRNLIAEMGDFVAVPIVSTLHPLDQGERDIEGFQTFAELFLKRKQVVLREMLDPAWWHEVMTPLRLKHVISKLDLLVSQRKHNIIHAIGCGVPFVGIFPDDDDSILRIVFSLRHRVPPGSSVLPLGTDRYPSG
ncbi:MAG TPA: hypothetical protein VH332_08440 [Nitrospira sp.]|jgi:hypothetical protein